MSTFTALIPPHVDNLTLVVSPPSTIRLAGTVTMADPAAEIGVFFKAVHAAALSSKLAEVTVDVSRLTFVNSSSIRLFVDWVGLLRAAPSTGRYHLRFLTSRHVSWQRSSFSALLSLARSVISVESVD